MARLSNIPHSLCFLLVVVALANASVTWRRVTKPARSFTQDLTTALAPSTTKSTITWRRSTKSRRSTTRREEPPPPVEEDDIDTADSREQASLFEDDSDQGSPIKPLVPGSRPGFWLDSSRRKKPSSLLKPGVRRNSLFPTKPSRRTTVSTTTEKLTPVPIVSFASKTSVTTPQPVSSPSKLKLYGRNQSTKSPVAFRRRIKVTKSPRISSTTAAPVSEESDIVEELSLEPEEKRIKNNERELETNFKSISENTDENSAENVQSKPPKSIQKPSLGIRRRSKNGTRLSWRKGGLRVTPRTTSAPRSPSSSTTSIPDVTSTKLYGKSRRPSAFPRIRSRVRANKTTSSPKIWTREEQSSTSPETPTTVKVQDKKRLERIRFHTRNRNTHKFNRFKARPLPEESEEQQIEYFTTPHSPTEYEVTLTPTTPVYEVSTSRTTVEPYYLTRDYGQLITAIVDEHWTKDFSSTLTSNPLKTSTDSLTRTTIPEPTSAEISTQAPFPTILEEEIYTNGTTESSEEAFQYPEEPQYVVSNYSKLSQNPISNQNEDPQYDISNQDEDNQYPVPDQNKDVLYPISDQNEDVLYPISDQNEDVLYPISDQNEAPLYTESSNTTYEDDSENIVEEAFVSVTSKPLEIGGNLKNQETITDPSPEKYQSTTSRPFITFPTISHTINPGTNAYVVWSLGQGGSSWSYERQGEQVKWSAQNSAAAGDRWSVQGEDEKIKIDHTPWKPTRNTSKFLSEKITSKKNDSKVPLTDKLNKEKPEEPVTYTPSVPYLKQIPLKIQTTPETYNFPPLSDDEFSKISSDFTNFTSSFYQDTGINFLPDTQDAGKNFGTWLNGSSVFYSNTATPYTQPNGKETFIDPNKLNVPYIAEIRETYNDVPNFDQTQPENASNSQGQLTDTPNISEENPRPYKLPEISYGIGFDYNLPQTTYSPYLSAGAPSYATGPSGSPNDGQAEIVSTNYHGSSSFSGLPPELAKAVVDAKRWTVVGSGGPEGWSLLGEDGILEWKIHNIDGKWTVTSADELVKMPLQIPASSSEAVQDSEQDKTESQKSEEVQKTRPKIWTLEDDYEKWRVLSAERGVQVGSSGNRPNTEYDYDQTEENQEDDYYDEDEEEGDYGEPTNAYTPYQFNENFEDRPLWGTNQMIPNYIDNRPNSYSPYGREIEAANTKDDAIAAWKSLLVDQGTWKLSAEEKRLANPSLSHQYHYSNPTLSGSNWKVSSPPAIKLDRSDEDVQTPQITALGNYAGTQGKPAAEYKPFQTKQNQKSNTPTAEDTQKRKHDKENGRPLQEKDRAKIEALIKKLESIQKEAKGRAVIDLSQLLKLVKSNKNSTSALPKIKSIPDLRSKTSNPEIAEAEIRNGNEQVIKEKHSKQSQQDSDENKLNSLVQNLQQQTSISQNSLDELQKYIESLKEKRLDNNGKGINRKLEKFTSGLNYEQTNTGIQGKTDLENKFYDKVSEAKDYKFLSSLSSHSSKSQVNMEGASNQRRPNAEDGSKLKPIENNKYLYHNNRRADENLNENVSFNDNYRISNGLSANSRYKLSHQNIDYINGQKVSDVRHEEKRIYSDNGEYDEHFRSISKHLPGAYSSKKHFSDLIAPEEERSQTEERYRSKVPSFFHNQPGYPYSDKPAASQKKSDTRLEEDKGPNGEIAFEDDYRLSHGRNQRYSKSKPRRKQNRPRTGSRGKTLRPSESLLQNNDGQHSLLTHTNAQNSKEIGYTRPKYSSAEIRGKHQSSRRRSRPGRKSQQQKQKSSVRPHTKLESSEELIVNVRDHPQIYDSYEEKQHLEEHFYEPSPNTHLRRQRRPSKRRPYKPSRSPPVVLSSETEIEDEEDGSKKSRKIIVIDYAGRQKKKSPIDRKDLELIIRNVKNRRSELMEESSSERRHRELIKDP
ncbi:unnamed protein product [Larinioides sclopetarius]|uniref:Uncharacterized protein n=1 Tax=Larinioides sclopetarius TaxID=280406 RepID=A0AAV1ZI42_9ARAC